MGGLQGSKALLCALALALTGCEDQGGGKGGGGNGGGGDGGEDASIIGPDNVVMDDSDSGLQITVEGGTASGWRFGAIEPRVDIYEEGCRDSDDICHTLGANGGTLDWASSCGSNSDGATCIAQLYWRQGQMSFVIMPETGVGCWAWGDDAATYYDDCIEKGWEPDSY